MRTFLEWVPAAGSSVQTPASAHELLAELEQASPTNLAREK